MAETRDFAVGKSTAGQPTQSETVLRPCPICGKLAALEYRPFCSKRCADIDLHRWLKEGYAIPVVPEPEDDEALPEGEPSQEDRD
jgi:uncharacterized protein